MPRLKPIPPFRRLGFENDFATLAELRRLSVPGLRAASAAGVLAFGDCCGQSSWFVQDRSGWCFEARRMDGALFPEKPGALAGRKAHTTKGSVKSWPVGIDPASGVPGKIILVVEGGPDLLAAFDLCHHLGRSDITPVAILGRSAGSRIHVEALPLFAGRRVRILPHADDDGGGVQAAGNWAAQISSAGGDVEVLRLNTGIPASVRLKDVNDLVALYPGHLHCLGDLIP